MPRTSEMVQSKYLKTADVPDPVIVTVTKVGKVNLAKEDAAPEYKWAIRFQEFDKPMVLNSTNIKRLGKALGDETDGWKGGQVTLYVDPDIEFGGNIVGGLRIRASKAPSSSKQVVTANGDKDDLPW